MNDIAVPTPVFHRITPGVLAPMPADKSALGVVPAAAHQYCEPLRVASSLGWYVFPPCDIQLKFDGAHTLINSHGEWQMLSAVVLPEFVDAWLAEAPQDMAHLALPHVSAPFVPGVVQIWSGLLMRTPPGWSALVRPIANQPASQSYTCYEGLIETDVFCPCPVFVNIRLHAVDVVLEFSRLRPLFQVQLVPKVLTAARAQGYELREGMAGGSEGEAGLSPQDWQGLRDTMRVFSSTSAASVGRYGAMVRKRAKHEDAPGS